MVLKTVDSIDKDDVLNAESALISAIKNVDISNLDKLLHDDLLFNLPSGQTITKAQDMEVYRSGGMRVESIIAQDPDIQIIGETAVVCVVIEIKGKYFDHILDGTYKYLRVWSKFGEDLTVIAGSCAILESDDND